jgi:hypothetical protein
MITSSHNTFGCWLYYSMTSLFLSFFFAEILNHYSIAKINYFTTLNDKGFNIMALVVGGASAIFLFSISAFIKKISIDQLSETIGFKNIITRQTKTYNFSDFDGIADTYLTHKSSSYKTIGLVKDKIVVRYMDSFWISNYEALRQFLNGMKCLGTFDFGTWKQLKLLLRRPVID